MIQLRRSNGNSYFPSKNEKEKETKKNVLRIGEQSKLYV